MCQNFVVVIEDEKSLKELRQKFNLTEEQALRVQYATFGIDYDEEIKNGPNNR